MQAHAAGPLRNVRTISAPYDRMYPRTRATRQHQRWIGLAMPFAARHAGKFTTDVPQVVERLDELPVAVTAES